MKQAMARQKASEHPAGTHSPRSLDPPFCCFQDVEAALMKQDIARQKISERQNAPGAAKRLIEANEAAAQRRRGRMMLPAPQVGGVELVMWGEAGHVRVGQAACGTAA